MNDTLWALADAIKRRLKMYPEEPVVMELAPDIAKMVADYFMMVWGMNPDADQQPCPPPPKGVDE